jgi:hypothetical protein
MMSTETKTLVRRPDVVIVTLLLTTSIGLVSLAFLNVPFHNIANGRQLVGACDSALENDYSCDEGLFCVRWDEEEELWIVETRAIPIETVMKVVAGTLDVVGCTVECGLEFMGNAVTGVCDFIGSIFKDSFKIDE